MLEHKDSFSLIGDMGEHYVQFLLGRIGIDAVMIDRVYDLFLWQRMHRVEVKTSRVYERNYKRKHDGKTTKAYAFKFFKPQMQKDAFDYAICVGYDIDYNPKDVFVIPQSYIYEQAKRNNNLENKSVLITIPTKRPIKNVGFFRLCNNYDKFRMCKDNLDVFKQDNKPAFTRKKNQLTKRLLSYEDDCLESMKEEFLRIYTDKNIHNPSQVVEDELGIKTLWKKGYTREEIKKELQLNSRRITRICRELTLPRDNPYRPKRVPWNKGKHTGNQYTGRLNKE